MSKTEKQKQAATSKIIEDELNAFNLRNSFSADDITSLINNMDSLISGYKAEQKGFDPKNMVKTVRGGKTVWITKDEMNSMLSKRRRFYAKEKFQQNNDTVQESSESQRRLSLCQMMIDSIRLASVEKSLEFVKFKRNLEALMNQSISQANEFKIMEDALKRKKEEDPIYQDMKLANEKMMSALENNNLEDADICQTYFSRHADKFESIQARIDAYEKKVKECKNNYLLKKQRVYCYQFEIVRRGSKEFVDFIKEILYYDQDGSVSKNTITLLKSLQSTLSSMASSIRILNTSTIEELVSNPSCFSEVDQNIMELYDQLLLFLESFNHAWSQCVIDLSKQSSSEKPQSGRMAYATKNIS